MEGEREFGIERCDIMDPWILLGLPREESIGAGTRRKGSSDQTHRRRRRRRERRRTGETRVEDGIESIIMEKGVTPT